VAATFWPNVEMRSAISALVKYIKDVKDVRLTLDRSSAKETSLNMLMDDGVSTKTRTLRRLDVRQLESLLLLTAQLDKRLYAKLELMAEHMADVNAALDSLLNKVRDRESAFWKRDVIATERFAEYVKETVARCDNTANDLYRKCTGKEIRSLFFIE